MDGWYGKSDIADTAARHVFIQRLRLLRTYSEVQDVCETHTDGQTQEIGRSPVQES
jgi:hypothetical protein